jgi:outer membrane protein
MPIHLPKNTLYLFMGMFLATMASQSFAQSTDTVLQDASIDNVVAYALVHQPVLRQVKIDEEITEKAIKGRLADWYPQINFAYNYQHVFDLQANVVQGRVAYFGVHNTSSAQFTVNQAIFNRDVLLARSTASTVRIQADQNTTRTKIDVVVAVKKAFYDYLATSQQIKVSEESITRLQRSLKDAQSRYNAGLSDKTDYKRATIQLGNAETALKANTELLKVKEEYLKTLMGYPLDKSLSIQYDTLQMEGEIPVDTLQTLNVTEHIDYKLLYTQKELQDANVKYSYWAFLPTIDATGGYNFNYQNDKFGELYNQRFPYSYFGATLRLPIFQGGKRNLKIQEQKWARKRIDEGLDNIEHTLTTEYVRAVATYKSNLANYNTQKENVALAEEVYNVIQLQYQNGVKTYLDVTIAESDLRTTRINYFNSLYQVLSSKLDVQRVLGQINY